MYFPDVLRSSCHAAQPTVESYDETILPSKTLEPHLPNCQISGKLWWHSEDALNVITLTTFHLQSRNRYGTDSGLSNSFNGIVCPLSIHAPNRFLVYGCHRMADSVTECATSQSGIDNRDPHRLQHLQLCWGCCQHLVIVWSSPLVLILSSISLVARTRWYGV